MCVCVCVCVNKIIDVIFYVMQFRSLREPPRNTSTSRTQRGHRRSAECRQRGHGSVPSYAIVGNMVLSLRFNGHFPGEPGLAGVY